MDKYIINGHEIEFDTWDQINLELFDSERKRTMEMIKQIEDDLNDENAVASLREISDVIRDFFDTVLGEGSSDEIFGDRVNAVKESAAMIKFIEDVSDTFARPPIIPSPAQATNRQQRRKQERATEREKRRMEAAARVAVKNGSVNAISNIAENAL